ncbi:hypothetical protein B0T16DRAFT_460833 [Cercophora newfieldiana]|uniref:Uncharacterized protein n=1 Tax=Cercophora newfieldiana TaxID=92897 RepID=A0AA40CJG9_9PEZI|nr:hypothetical protein B0T16DRAFT_460833 [Cercophora newfieldiana]
MSHKMTVVQRGTLGRLRCRIRGLRTRATELEGETLLEETLLEETLLEDAMLLEDIADVVEEREAAILEDGIGIELDDPSEELGTPLEDANAEGVSSCWMAKSSPRTRTEWVGYSTGEQWGRRDACLGSKPRRKPSSSCGDSCSADAAPTAKVATVKTKTTADRITAK